MHLFLLRIISECLGNKPIPSPLHLLKLDSKLSNVTPNSGRKNNKNNITSYIFSILLIQEKESSSISIPIVLLKFSS